MAMLTHAERVECLDCEKPSRTWIAELSRWTAVLIASLGKLLGRHGEKRTATLSPRDLSGLSDHELADLGITRNQAERADHLSLDMGRIAGNPTYGLVHSRPIPRARPKRRQ